MIVSQAIKIERIQYPGPILRLQSVQATSCGQTHHLWIMSRTGAPLKTFETRNQTKSQKRPQRPTPQARCQEMAHEIIFISENRRKRLLAIPRFPAQCSWCWGAHW